MPDENTGHSNKSNRNENEDSNGSEENRNKESDLRNRLIELRKLKHSDEANSGQSSKYEQHHHHHHHSHSKHKLMRMMNDAEVNEIVSEEEDFSEDEVKSKSPRSDKISAGKSTQSGGDSQASSRSASRSPSEERVEPKRPRRPSSSSSKTGESGDERKRGTPGESDRSMHNEDSQDLEDRTPEFGDLPVEKPHVQTVTYYCALQGCRSVEEFECLNKIEEGAYGVVYRAKDKKSNEVVALKRLKMEKEKEGFPITSIREVDTLLKAQHPNVVTVREIVVGSNMDKIYMVMDYVEHDLKSLMQYSMKKPFLMSEVKTLMLQLLSGVAHLHDNWIIHRDLKTSNLLLSHKGVLKIADFGLAREYGSPLKEYTAVVVTLWYRSPELLLNTKKYSTGIDIWSVGCIFGELMLMKALFPGKNEKDQLDKIFKDLGTPNEKIWPGWTDLPLAKAINFPHFPYNTLRSRFGNYLSDKGFELINKLLTYDPIKRISAEDALKHDFFKETPLPIDPTYFPTWPAKSEGLSKAKKPQDSEPRAPSAGKMYEKMLAEDDGFVLQQPIATGFTLR